MAVVELARTDRGNMQGPLVSELGTLAGIRDFGGDLTPQKFDDAVRAFRDRGYDTGKLSQREGELFIKLLNSFAESANASFAGTSFQKITDVDRFMAVAEILVTRGSEEVAMRVERQLSAIAGNERNQILISNKFSRHGATRILDKLKQMREDS